MQDFETELITIPIGPFDIRLNKVKNIDVLYDALLAKGEEHEDVRDERIPYWAELWTSSIALSQYLVSEFKDLKGKSILEIGCGLGLCGITAGLLGGEVIMSDYMQEPLNIAQSNWELNISGQAKTVILDWRKPDLKYKADIILASDVLYEKRSHEYLADFFQVMLNPGGMILLADPQRSASVAFFQKYEALLGINKLITIREINPDIKTSVDIYSINHKE